MARKRNVLCEWSRFFVYSGLVAPFADYDAPETLVVREPEQLRALGDDVRAKLIALLRHNARSTQQLAEHLEMPKGTVGHHLKVLESAGLIHVVRTRKVRALTEKFYGRTARLFIFEADSAPETVPGLGASMLRNAADEVSHAPAGVNFAHIRSRLKRADARRFTRRLDKLVADFQAADIKNGDDTTAMYSLVASFWSPEGANPE
jgi:DNA-binding transcriptional ArsR family regulator